HRRGGRRGRPTERRGGRGHGARRDLQVHRTVPRRGDREDRDPGRGDRLHPAASPGALRAEGARGMTATSRQPRAAASAGVGLVPPRVRLFSPLQWTAILAVFLAAGVVVPVLHATLPQDSPFWPDSYAITLLGKFTCYAMVAVAMDLIWGYTGILSLGQSLFFALGGYAFGMYLMRGIGREGQYGSHLPDFMV